MPKASNQTDCVVVTTLNLRFGRADDGENSWKARKHALKQFLQTYPSDIYGFQEANDFQVDYLRKLLPKHDMIGERRPAPKFWQSNVIFFPRSIPCETYQHFYLSPTPWIPSRFRKSRWPRQCTLGVFALGKQKLVVINTHFDFDEEVQLDSAKIICQQLRDFPKAMPMVLMGDFNAVPGSLCYRLFTEPDCQDASSFRHRFRNVFNPPFPCTHHGFTGTTQGPHIDWILFHGNLELRKAMVIWDRFNGKFPSDHFPIQAELRFIDSY